MKGWKHMKKFMSVLLSICIFALVLTATGCGKQDSSSQEQAQAPAAAETPAKASEEPAKDTSKEKKFKVAVLLPGTVNDQGWCATAYKGLMDIKEKLGAEVSYTESVAASDYEEVFRGYATQGYDLVFGHGFQFGDAAQKVAKDFPNVKFCITSSTVAQAPNVSSINNDSLQNGFLAGAMAALVSKNKSIGSIGGEEMPPIVNFNKGFELGAKYIDPSIKVSTAITGNFVDAPKAKETAIAMIGKGVDVLTQNANQASLGVIDAAKEKGILDIGAIGDQASVAPDVVVTSAVNDMSVALVVAAQKAKEGTLEPKFYNFGVKEGAVGMTSYGNFESKLSQEIKDKMAQILKDLESGKIDVNALNK